MEFQLCITTGLNGDHNSLDFFLLLFYIRMMTVMISQESRDDITNNHAERKIDT